MQKNAISNFNFSPFPVVSFRMAAFRHFTAVILSFRPISVCLFEGRYFFSPVRFIINKDYIFFYNKFYQIIMTVKRLYHEHTVVKNDPKFDREEMASVRQVLYRKIRKSIVTF